MAPTPPLDGDLLLEAVTASMITLHERYYHRAPATAKTQRLGDDLIACVLGNVYTDVEKTMIEMQRGPLVKETRSLFEGAMRRRFTAEIERLTGREVSAFVSNSHIGPDTEVELFFLGGPA
jgi:uncharacterized protein YbcI